MASNESGVAELSTWRGPCGSTGRDGSKVSSEGRRQATRRRQPSQLGDGGSSCPGQSRRARAKTSTGALLYSGHAFTDNVVLFTCKLRSGPSGATGCYAATLLFTLIVRLPTRCFDGPQQPVEVAPAKEPTVGDDGADLLRIADVIERVGIE